MARWLLKPYNDPLTLQWNYLLTHYSLLDLYRDGTPLLQSVTVTPAQLFPLRFTLESALCELSLLSFPHLAFVVVMPQQLVCLSSSMFVSPTMTKSCRRSKKPHFNRPDTYYSNLQAVSMNHNNHAHFIIFAQVQFLNSRPPCSYISIFPYAVSFTFKGWCLEKWTI